MPDIIIVMLTMSDHDEQLFEALSSGAQGYLLKNIRSQELLEQLRGVMRGEAVFSPEVTGHVLQLLRNPPKSEAEETLPLNGVILTRRQKQILALIAYENAADKDIADRFPVALNTVKTHVRNILAKLGCRSRHEAAQLGIRQGLISPRDVPPKRIL
jgi:DNA-binding NarL/FixJ family response regulator